MSHKNEEEKTWIVYEIYDDLSGKLSRNVYKCL